MAYIQSLIDNYYRTNDNILTGFAFFLVILILIIWAVVQEKGISLYSLWEKIVLSIVIGVFGMILSRVDLMPHIEYTYYVLLFLIFIAVFVINLILLFCKYKKVISIFVNYIRYFQYAFYLEFFLLAGANALRDLIFVDGILCVCLLEAICQIYTQINHKKESIEADRLPESDWPNLELYPSRELQLKKFIPTLQQMNSEPYAIMISCAWGGGKTSFVRALAADSSFSNDNFIWIEAGGEKSAADIMSSISERIIDVLKTKNIYLENTGTIDKYFQAFSGVLDETGWKLFNKIGSVFTTNVVNENTKEYLNRKLAALKSKIYLIVDDLDRCEEEYKEKMFKVIRESTQLTNCKTIFLADRKHFLNETYDNNYIEKYISCNLELCPVAYEEIVHYYFDIIFSDARISDIRQQIWHNRDSAMLRKEILELPDQIVSALIKEIARKKRAADSINAEQNALNIQHMQDAVTMIETDTMNSRKVKNFLKGIKAGIINLNAAWNDSSMNEYLDKDWISIIIRVQFLKHFFQDYYWEIYSCHRIEKYRGIQSKWIKELLLGVSNNGQRSDDRTVDILNLCIYKLDLLDFEKDKTVEQVYLDELRGDSPDISHVEQYIRYATSAEGYSDYQKILKLYHEQTAGISLYQKRIVINDLLHQLSQIYISELDAFFRLSEDIIAFLKTCLLSETEIYSCGQRGREIISNCLTCNNETLKVPLQAVFGIKFFGTEVEDFQPANFEQFYYLLLRIDGNVNDRNNDTNVYDYIEMVQQYYEQLEEEIQKPAYAELYHYIKTDLEKCRLIFKICRLWDNIETIRQSRTNENAALIKYFSLDQMTYTENTFHSMENLEEALELLEQYYESRERENQYLSDVSLLFARTVANILRLCKEEPSWAIQIREKTVKVEVEVRIRRIAQIVYKLEQSQTEQSRNTIKQIRIMVFTLERFLQEADTE